MKSFELGWKSQDGLDLFARAWEPEQKPRAVVCLLHGLGEHTGRYENAARALTHAGYAVFGFDQRGHGRSGGPRGHTPSYEALMQDIDLLLAQAAQRYPHLPRFLYGHSMGANEALNYVLRRKPDLAGAIASGPWLRLAFVPPASKVKAGRLMNGIFPRYSQSTGLDIHALSHDPKVAEAYRSDPLVHDRISARMYVDLFDSGAWALAHAAEFPLPLLLMHGGQDRLTSADASREFARAGGSHITLQIWDADLHEVHNELDQEDVFRMMVIWMDARLAV